MSKFTPCLWFTDEGEAAARLYTSIFPNSRIVDAQSLTVLFELDGQSFLALNGGDEGFRFSEAISFQVSCDSQEEVDRYWDALTAEGGEPGPCGWLKDRFGVSWQIVPKALPGLLSGEHGAKVMAALRQMGKLDIAALEAAAK